MSLPETDPSRIFRVSAGPATVCGAKGQICIPIIPLCPTKRAAVQAAAHGIARDTMRPLARKNHGHSRCPGTTDKPTVAAPDKAIRGSNTDKSGRRSRGMIVATVKGMMHERGAGSRRSAREPGGSHERTEPATGGDPARRRRAGSRRQRCAYAARRAPHPGGSRGKALRLGRGDRRTPDSAELVEPGGGGRRRIARGAGPSRRRGRVSLTSCTGCSSMHTTGPAGSSGC